MKYKAKPIERAELRERVEKKFRARGAVLFHGLVFLLGTALFLWYLPTFWETRFARWDLGFRDAILLHGLLTVSFALHFIYYHFKHGSGYERHEAETAARINRELRRSGLDEAEEREALIEVEQNEKLKNRRLLWQHASLFLGLNTIVILTHWTQVIRNNWNDEFTFLGVFYVVGAWGIAMAAHALRYYFAYGSTSENRQAKIDAEVAREMAALRLDSGDDSDAIYKERALRSLPTEAIVSGAVDEIEQRRRQSSA